MLLEDYNFVNLCLSSSEDDIYIIYATLYSGLDAYFVTRDLLRSEKFGLSEEQRSLFKRWQQSHQIFITYVAPSGKVYMKVSVLNLLF